MYYAQPQRYVAATNQATYRQPQNVYHTNFVTTHQPASMYTQQTTYSAPQTQTVKYVQQANNMTQSAYTQTGNYAQQRAYTYQLGQPIQTKWTEVTPQKPAAVQRVLGKPIRSKWTEVTPGVGGHEYAARTIQQPTTTQYVTRTVQQPVANHAQYAARPQPQVRAAPQVRQAPQPQVRSAPHPQVRPAPQPQVRPAPQPQIRLAPQRAPQPKPQQPYRLPAAPPSPSYGNESSNSGQYSALSTQSAPTQRAPPPPQRPPPQRPGPAPPQPDHRQPHYPERDPRGQPDPRGPDPRDAPQPRGREVPDDNPRGPDTQRRGERTPSPDSRSRSKKSEQSRELQPYDRHLRNRLRRRKRPKTRFVPQEVLDIPPRRQPPVNPAEFGGQKREKETPDDRTDGAGLVKRRYGARGEWQSVWAYKTPLDLKGGQNPAHYEDALMFHMYENPNINHGDPYGLNQAMQFENYPLKAHRNKSGIRVNPPPTLPTNKPPPPAPEPQQQKKGRWSRFFKRGNKQPPPEPETRRRSQSYPPPVAPWGTGGISGTAAEIFPQNRMDAAGMSAKMRAHSPDRYWGKPKYTSRWV